MCVYFEYDNIIYSVSQKNPPPRGPDIFFILHKRLRICN